MNKYRHLGIKLTPQRIAVLEFLEGNTAHPSAEEIYLSMKTKFPTMSLATVYSTLSALAKKGNVLELTIDPDKKRYDPNIGPHNHFICLSCKTIIDVPGNQAVGFSHDAAHQFDIIKSHIEFFGYCPDCNKKRNKQHD